MDDGVDGVLAAQSFDEGFVSDVADDQRRIDDGVGVAELERVEHHDVAAARNVRTVCEPM